METPSTPSTSVDARPVAEVVVVGAGITGLITAVLLARAGQDVLVLEARNVGSGTTGNTTAKISLLQASKLSRIIAKQGPTLAQKYLQGHREGQAWLLRHCEKHGIDLQREDAYTSAQSPDGIRTARAEFDPATSVGLDVQWVDDADVPFPFHGGVRLREQAQFDPMPLLDSLLTRLEGPATGDLARSL